MKIDLPGGPIEVSDTIQDFYRKHLSATEYRRAASEQAYLLRLCDELEFEPKSCAPYIAQIRDIRLSEWRARQKEALEAWEIALDVECAVFDAELAHQFPGEERDRQRERWACARAEAELCRQGIVPPHFKSLATCRHCGEMPAEAPAYTVLDKCPWCEWTALYGDNRLEEDEK